MPPSSVRFWLLASAVFAISTFGAAEAREGPGFDCAKAHQPLAQFICADDSLASIDLRLNQAYSAYRYTLTPEGKKNLDKDEVAFIRNVIVVCQIPEKMVEPGLLTESTDDLPKQRDCIAKAYAGRTEILTIWGLPRKETSQPPVELAVPPPAPPPPSTDNMAALKATVQTCIRSVRDQAKRPENFFYGVEPMWKNFDAFVTPDARVVNNVRLNGEVGGAYRFEKCLAEQGYILK